MTQKIYVGVDGGATKSIVSVQDASGKVLGREIGGPANIRLSVPQAWQSILLSLNKILKSQSLSIHRQHYQLHAGMGIAGCEVRDAYQEFTQYAHPFETLVVTSDAHTACLGAHNGKDGAIIIAGTGVVGYQTQADQISKVSGWGFPHDDEGSGAWIGLEAVRATLQWLDGRAPVSGVAKAVFAHFKQNQSQLVFWANQANSTAYAQLAPLVIEQSKLQDAKAISILQQAGSHVSIVHKALVAAQQDKRQALPCSLVGGVAAFLEPYLSDSLRACLRPPCLTPDVGAILLVRHHLKEYA